MPKIRYYLPVLLLYIITSTLMLFSFSALFYHHKSSEIYENTAFALREKARIVHHFLRREGDLAGMEGFRDIEIVAHFDGDFVIKDFEPDFSYIKEIATKEHKNRKNQIAKMWQDSHKAKSEANKSENITLFFKDNKYAYYAFVRPDIRLLLRTSEPALALSQIFSILCVICAVAFAFFCAVGYFIVRMSYAPLLAHIKGLNTFITDTTHEVNTPLSVILMSVEMFEKNPQKYLSNIKLASKSLSMLFSDLSANLKVIPLHFEQIELAEFLKQRVEFFELLSNKKQLSFELEIENFSLKTDPFRLGKIMDNIISNAIKYSFTGEKIKIILKPKSFEVSQKGVVIPAQKIDKIYDKFTRFDSTNGGFGIGLSLVKSYCDELGYKINATSSEEKTTFIVSFEESQNSRI